jgi:signal transduction histidine kinase/ActR/RegA family two-component response regulator
MTTSMARGDSTPIALDTSDTTEDQTLSELIDAEAIKELYNRIPTVIMGTLLLSSVMAAGIIPSEPTAEVLSWQSCVVMALSHRYILLHRFRHEGEQAHSPQILGRRFAVGSFVLGSLWGIAGVLFFDADALGKQLLLFSMIVGVTISGINNNAVWPRTYYAFVIPSIGLLAARMFVEGTAEYIAMGFGLCIYILVAIRLSNSANRNFRMTVRLNLSNIDLVERLRKEKEKADQANAAKTRFLASASHDLRQPVHSLALFNEVLEQEVQSERGRQVLGHMDNAIDALNQLLTSLLDISKLDAGIVVPEVYLFEVDDVLNSLYNEFKYEADKKGLLLQKTACHYRVKSDPALFGNILRNLLGNAIRYTPSGKVLLRCHRRGERLAIQVWDSGPGISRADHEHVFQEFHQLHNPERDRSQGLGLGLAICRRLTDLLGHRLYLHSRPGRGTVFTLELPLDHEPGLIAETQLPARTLPSVLQGKVVMFIDDELTVREATETVLTSWGCQVLCAEGIETALALAASVEKPLDIIVSDYRLRNHTTGVEAIEALHRQAGRAIPAVLVTGDTDPQRIKEARQSGHILLHKPIKPAQLRTVLNSVVRGE